VKGNQKPSGDAERKGQAELTEALSNPTCSYLLAMADLSLETARIEERQRRTKRESEELLERTRKGIAKLAQLKRTLSELEREEESHRGPMQTWNEYMQIMISKDRQYTQQLVNYKVSLTTLVEVFTQSRWFFSLDGLAGLRTGSTRSSWSTARLVYPNHLCQILFTPTRWAFRIWTDLRSWGLAIHVATTKGCSRTALAASFIHTAVD
jgi:hypothetical protein